MRQLTCAECGHEYDGDSCDSCPMCHPVTVNWRDHTCSECGYYVGKSPKGAFIGCRKMPGNTTKACPACPDLVLREVPDNG